MPEERVSPPAVQTRTVVYQESRVIPHRGWSLGWVATVRYWNVEAPEVEISFEGDRVREVQARIRRVAPPLRPRSRL